jgi:hypothetical protein
MSTVEKGNINAATSSVAIDETTYILLKFKAAEILDTRKHYKILENYIMANNIETEGLFYEMALVSTSISPTEKEYIRRIEIKKK